MYQFGCCCKAEHIERLANIGFDYAELSADEIASMSEAEFENTQELLLKNNLKCLALNDYCQTTPAIVGDQFSPEGIIEHAEKVCSRAAQLGAHCIGIGAPLARRLPQNYSASLAEEQATQFLKLTGKVASKYPNLYILMEALNNTVCNFCNTQESSLHLVQMVSMPNVQMEVDFFHMLMMNEPFESFSAYVDRTKHIHISGKSPDGVRRFFVPEEQSLCQSMISAIAKTTYQGTISVEAPLNTFTDESAFRSLQIMQKAALGE